MSTLPDKQKHTRALLANSRNVGEVEGGRGRVDILVVLGAGLLEAVQRRVGVVLSETGVRLPLLGQLHRLVLRGHHPNLLAEHVQLVHVGHG